MSPSIHTIKRHVARAFGVTIAEIDGPRRASDVVLPRHMAIYLARQLTRRSLPEIGRHFGDRDHATIINACRRMEARMAGDPALATRVASLKATLPATNEVGDETGSLYKIAQAAQRQAVRRAKTEIGAFVYGRRSDLRAALKYLYRETPVAAGRYLAGGTVELLVSEDGTWSIIESADIEFSALLCSGTAWTKGSEA